MSLPTSLSYYWRAFEFSTVTDQCLASISSSSFCCFPFLHMWPFSRAEYADVDDQPIEAPPQQHPASWAPQSASALSASGGAQLYAPVAAPVFSSHLASATFSSPERLSASLALADAAPLDGPGRRSDGQPHSSSSSSSARRSEEKRVTPKKVVRIAEDERRSSSSSKSAQRSSPERSRSSRGAEGSGGGRNGRSGRAVAASPSPPSSSSSPPPSVPARASSHRHRDEDVSESDSGDDDDPQVVDELYTPMHDRALPGAERAHGKAKSAHGEAYKGVK